MCIRDSTDILNNLIQPVDPYSDYIDLSDSIWDSTRDLTEMLTINGKHYYAAVSYTHLFTGPRIPLNADDAAFLQGGDALGV